MKTTTPVYIQPQQRNFNRTTLLIIVSPWLVIGGIALAWWLA